MQRAGKGQFGNGGVGEGITGRVVETDRLIVVARASGEPLLLNRAPKRPARAEQEWSVVCVPILLNRKAIGALLVHLSHGPARADDVREIVSVAKFQPEVGVFGFQPLAILLDQPLNLDRLGQHGGDHAQKLGGAVVITGLAQTTRFPGNTGGMQLEGFTNPETGERVQIKY